MSLFDLTRATLEQHSIDLRQFIDFRHSTLSNGMRVVNAHNSSGLTFTLLPDRGLDIWAASYNGRPLTWLSQGSPHRPDFGNSWLRLFNGGLLVTCGLCHAGPPEADERSGEQRDLHGNYTRLPAQDLATQGAWRDDIYTLSLAGTIAEAALFGEQLRLTRTLSMTLGAPAVEITDIVENLYDMPAPLMILYHFNFGYPLVQDGVSFHTASATIQPRDVPARAAFATWQQYRAAVPRHLEEVFFHQVHAGSDGIALAALASDTFGIQVEWDTTNEPYLTQWKNFRRGIYVCGVEPGNCVPEGQNRARRSGRLVMLAPGERQIFHNRLTVLPDGEAVTAMRARIEELRAGGRAVDVMLGDYDA